MFATDRLEFKEIEGHYMMATKAKHPYILDCSSPSHELCFIYGEAPNFFVGRWVTRYENFFDVKFSKITTRDLNSEEAMQYKDHLERDLTPKPPGSNT